MRWRSPDRSYEEYQYRPPAIGLATVLLGAGAVGAGLLSTPGVARGVLGRLSRWSIEYAAEHRSVARYRGLFWISSTANRLTRGGHGGEILHDLQQLALRQVMTSELDAYAQRAGLTGRHLGLFRRLVEESVATQTRVAALLRARSAQELFAGRQFEFVSHVLGGVSASDADRIMQVARQYALHQTKQARQIAAGLGTSHIEETIIGLARRDIRQGESLHPLLRWVSERAGYRQTNLLELYHGGLFAKTPEEARALAEGYRQGLRLPLHRMSRQELEQLMANAPDDTARKYYETVLKNYHSILSHLQVALDPEELIVQRSRGRVISFSVTRAGLERLERIAGTGMLVGEGNELLDLSYVMPALHHALQSVSANIGIPISPYLATLNPFRLFPWYRQSEHWFHRIGWSARQVGLNEALGRERGDILGAPIYVFGREAYALGLGDAASGRLQAQARASFERVAGQWRAVHIRGESMRGMLETMTGAATGRARHPLMEWLDLGGQQEESFWSKLRRAFRGGNGMDPLATVEQLRTADIANMTPQQILELVGRFGSMAEFVDIAGTFDEFQLLAEWSSHLEWLESAIPDSNRRRVVQLWRQMVQRVVQAGSYEKAIELFRAGGSEPAEWLSALAHQRGTQLLARLGYDVGNLLAGDTEIYPLSSALQHLLESNRNPWVWMSELRTPYRFPTLIDPIPDVALGRPDALPNVRFLMRGMLLESMQGVLDLTEQDRHLQREIYRRFLTMGASDEAASAWVYTSLFREGLNLSGDVSGLRVLLQAVQGHLRQPYAQTEALERFLTARRRWYHLVPLDVEEMESALATSTLMVRDYSDIANPWDRAVAQFRDWAAFFFTGDRSALNTWGLQSYFFAWRLNQMLTPYGLGLSGANLYSPYSIYRGLFLQRVLPVVGAVEAWKLFNTVTNPNPDETEPPVPTAVANTLQWVHIHAAGIQDALGITSLKKAIVGAVPGMDRYFQPRSRQELEWYYKYGFAEVRRGRGWLVASRTPVAGESVEAYVAPYARAMRSHWQAASNVGTSGRHYFLAGYSPLTNPLGALLERLTGQTGRRWAMEHPYDRPYPGVPRPDMPPISPLVGAGSGGGAGGYGGYGAGGGYGQGAGGGDAGTEPGSGAELMMLMRRPTDAERVRGLRLAREAYVGPGFVVPRQAWYQKGVPRAQYLASRGGGGYGPGEGGGPAGETIETDNRGVGAAREFIAYKHELAGLYGWGTNTLLGLGRGGLQVDQPGWAVSTSRRLWETRIGGLDVIPWQSELNEFYRRWFHRRKASDLIINPIPNNMPTWLPERFWYGDPYTKIPMGEMRLPGEAYRRLNPEAFRDDWLRMRASMLGATEDEMVAYLTSLEGDIEETEATRFGEREHRRIQRYLRTLGVLEGEEVSVYDPKHRISGHIDAIIRAVGGRSIVEIKTVGQEKFEKLGDAGIYKHRIQLFQYMYTTGIRRGGLLYVNRDDPTQVRFIPIRYNQAELAGAWNRLENVRRQVLQMVASGRLNEGYLYPDLVKFEILSDVAPMTPEWREMKARIQATASQLTPEQRWRFEEAKRRAERASKRYLTYPYRNIPTTRLRGRLIGVTGSGRLAVEDEHTGEVRYVKLAGLEWSESGLARALGQDAPLPELVQHYLARYGVRVGHEVEFEISQRLGDVRRMSRPYRAGILLSGGRRVYTQLVRAGVARLDPQDESDEATIVRRSREESFRNAVLDYFTHLDTPLHTKLLKVRSPLEEWKRSFVFGTIASSWEHPVSSYVTPTIQSAILSSGIMAAALKLGGFSTLFAQSRGSKIRFAMVGAAVGAAGSLLAGGLGIWGHPPPSTRKRWEIEEYLDLLQYIKYRALYERERQKALLEEGFDVERFIHSGMDLSEWMSGTRRRLRREQVIQQQLALERTDRVRREIEARRHREISRGTAYQELMRRNRERFHLRREGMQASGITHMFLRPHTRAALYYRERYLSTAYGADEDDSLSRLLRTVPARYRQLYREIIETGTERERREFYQLIPDYQKRLFRRWLAPDARPVRRRHPVQLLQKYGLPGRSWEGWRPDVDISPLIGPLLERAGIDPASAAVFPGQQVLGRELAARIGVPAPRASIEQVQRRLAILMGGARSSRIIHSIRTGDVADTAHYAFQIDEDSDEIALSQVLASYRMY